MKENDPSVVFKIQTSEEKLPERPVEDAVSENKNEQNKLDLKSLKKEITLEDLMDFLKKQKINPEEKTIEKYYKEIIDSKKDREIVSNVVKNLEFKKEEIIKELNNNPNNSEVLKKLQEINGKIGDLNSSEYLITDNIKNIVKNITNEFSTTDQNEGNSVSNNILNQNIYKFLTENVEQKLTENIKNINDTVENSLTEKIIYENKEEIPKQNIENLDTQNNSNTPEEKNSNEEEIKNFETQNQNYENNLKEETNNTSNIFNNIFKENESLTLNSNETQPNISSNILKPNFLEKEYKDENSVSLSSLENIGGMSEEAKKVISGQTEPSNSLQTKDFENQYLESINDVEENDVSMKDVGAIESDDIKNIIQPENKLVLDSLVENANDLGDSNIAENDLEHEMSQFEDDAIKQPVNGNMDDKFESLNVKEEGGDFNLKDMNPIAEKANVLENLDTLSSEMGDTMKISEPDYILEETRKTNGLIENLAKIMSEGFNGLMGSMSNTSRGTNMENSQNMVNETMNPHAPNPKVIQPNWITGYRDGVREGTGVKSALGYKTKLKGDNLGLYI